jgi:AcrR family transcriptional regulator
VLTCAAVPPETVLRVDAQRNRDAIVAAARAAFAEHGLSTSLDDIAKRAGVGSGTLYRHFASRDELVTAVFTERLAANVAAIERARENPDPWEGLCGYLRHACEAQAADRGLADIIAVGHRSTQLGALRERIYDGLVNLIGAAKAAGALRADFTPEDVVLLKVANAGIIQRTGSVASVASARFVALALDGFRADGASPAPDAPGRESVFCELQRQCG